MDYLDSYPTLPFNDLCSSWVKALSSLSDSPTQSDKKEKAASLLRSYKEVSLSDCLMNDPYWRGEDIIVQIDHRAALSVLSTDDVRRRSVAQR